jgi:hypothetical protein
MFNTTTATKKYVPVQDRAKLYPFGGTSPRARRFVASVRQLVHHDSATNAGSNPASLVVNEPLKICASNNRNPVFSESPTLEDNMQKHTQNSQEIRIIEQNNSPNPK